MSKTEACVQVAISFARIILISIHPGVETLGRVPGTETFCNIEQYPMATKIPGVLIIGVKSSILCFANANFVREKYLLIQPYRLFADTIFCFMEIPYVFSVTVTSVRYICSGLWRTYMKPKRNAAGWTISSRSNL